MGLRKKTEQTSFFKKFHSLHQNYGIDKVELGKIMIIASTTLLVASIPATLSMGKSANKIDSMNTKLGKASGIMESKSFQNSLDALTNIPGYGRQYQQASRAFNEATESLQKSQEVENELERTHRTYQWLVLIGILGEVVGIAVVYI